MTSKKLVSEETNKEIRYLSTTVSAEKLLLCQFGDKKCLFLTLGLLTSKLGTSCLMMLPPTYYLQTALLLNEGIPRALKGKMREKTLSQKSTVIALDF